MVNKLVAQKELPIDLLIRGSYQPRRHFAQKALEELAQSIKEHELVEPIVVRQVGDQYEIIAGERRWRAAQLAGLDTVRCEIREISDEEVAVITIIENIQREDLNPIEEAYAYARMNEEFGYIDTEIAHQVGKSRESVTNKRRLLKLDSKVQVFLEEGRLAEGFGLQLLALPIERQYPLARCCIQKHWSIKQLQKTIRSFKKGPNGQKKKSSNKAADIKMLENQLSERFGTKVEVLYNPKTQEGKVVFSYSSLDIFDGLLAQWHIPVEELVE